MRILIVDDYAMLRELWKRGLEHAGHTVVGGAVNGLEAIEKFRSLLPDVTIMDNEMPLMRGLEALQKIRSEFPNAAIIMCSSEDINLVARSLGAKAFIQKPVTVGDLLRAIANVAQAD